MLYSGSAQYAIRAVLHMATHYPDRRPVSAAGVAEAEGIPPFYLAKVLQDLGRSGLLGSVRGRGGGFFLTRAPEKVSVLEVIGAVQDLRRLENECILGLGACGDEVACPVHDIWKDCRERTFDTLKSTSVADLVTEMERKREAEL